MTTTGRYDTTPQVLNDPQSDLKYNTGTYYMCTQGECLFIVCNCALVYYIIYTSYR